MPESSLLAEFSSPDQARRVLEAVGSGDRTHANIAATAGGRQGSLPSGSLSPLLRRMVEEKRVLAADEPLSIRPGKPALYRVADSNLRLYLAALHRDHPAWLPRRAPWTRDGASRADAADERP
ncbi:hypothetical protein [Streptantibioticus ferralitis]|uniref:Transcriptional regulator n=1 Tax=Streptantibioticus ferralitis TaxID=236510 RepID=A0ABT5ZAM4_9ACTN|nr:hypothetical protein [Streptantibioticus ferralitis]MDF2260891.1 hypothetical protein [Streptantibioticus ferralitis]